MGYRVEYENSRFLPEKTGMRPARIFWMAAVVAALFLTAVYRYSGEGREVLLRLIDAAKGQQIGTALEAMVLQLRGGTGLGEALTAFCRDVVQMGLEFAA